MDYKNCTLAELADFVEVSPCSRISQQIIYYNKRDNLEMVEKILDARKVVTKRKLVKRLEAMA